MRLNFFLRYRSGFSFFFFFFSSLFFSKITCAITLDEREINRVSFSFHFFLRNSIKISSLGVKKKRKCNTQKTVERKTGERTMTEDNNPSHENKGERSKDDTENIKARERTNARKITTGESFLVVVAPFCFSSLSFSLAAR